MVLHLADQLRKPGNSVIESMNRVIEVDFLPREPNAGFSWPGSIGGSGMNEIRRILIVDNDRDITHLVKVLLEKNGALSRARRKRRYQGSSERPEFPARFNLA
jgi:hypothetical protein